MKTLTKNRIIQKGDEYSTKGEWKLVPETDWGLQVLFTKYSEVRRPSEETSTDTVKGEVLPSPIVPVVIDPGVATPVEITKAETEVEAITEAITVVSEAIGVSDSYLPTVVSKKAHDEERPRDPSDALRRAGLRMGDLGPIKIPFPAHANCQWTGRNGTFKGYGLTAVSVGGNVMLFPIGKRGTGNCNIQFPISAIPQLVDWLKTAFYKPKNKHTETETHRK